MVFLPITRAHMVSARRQKLVCPTCDCGAHQQLVDPLDARVGSLHPRDERSSHLEFGWSRPHGANRRCHTPRLEHRATNSRRNSACGLPYIRTIRSTPVRGLRKCPWRFGRFLKASMLGFTLVSRSYYYLRRRSPAPPFPPDDRQAQGTGGYR